MIFSKVEEYLSTSVKYHGNHIIFFWVFEKQLKEQKLYSGNPKTMLPGNYTRYKLGYFALKAAVYI